MPDFRGRLSAQAQLDGRITRLETKQVVSEPQTANFSARGNSAYIIEAPNTDAMIVVLPPATSSNRNESIELMHRNANTVRYVCLDGLVNKAASANVSGIGLVRFTSDGATGWFSASTGGGGLADGVYGSITVSGGGTIFRITDGVYGQITVSGGGLTWTYTGPVGLTHPQVLARITFRA